MKQKTQITNIRNDEWNRSCRQPKDRKGSTINCATLKADSEEELKGVLMRWKESEKAA